LDKGGMRRTLEMTIEVATKRQILDLSRHTVWGWGGAPLGKS
jgi:hypothetical protein